MENAGNPHYLPAADGQPADRQRTSWCCSICGASWQRPDAVYADITWVGFTGAQVPDEFARAFDAIAARP